MSTWWPVDVALYQPSIPQNTGNIGRLCVGMKQRLHLIGPCGFDLSEKAVRRAGLDYWQHLDWRLHEGPDAFLAWLGDRAPWLVTRHGQTRFDRVPWGRDDVLVFGNEASGLPSAWRARWPERTVRIPVLGPIRAFNLANAVAMIVSHANLRMGVFDDEEWSP
ncbi:MAG: tRNA (cytidine(34)-2'-O)-methyltransferase [Deltaproteobacteria bacterium]|nr:tRNA (cytidine(34)-2'-O)-methyltransferase [Deltaproteobacteria bacterium]